MGVSGFNTSLFHWLRRFYSSNASLFQVSNAKHEMTETAKPLKREA